MSILIELHWFAATCNRCNHMQPFLQFLDTANGYHYENSPHLDELGKSKRPTGGCPWTQH